MVGDVGGARGGKDGRLGILGEVRGQVEQDALGHLQPGLGHGLGNGEGGQFRSGLAAFAQGAGDFHAGVLSL